MNREIFDQFCEVVEEFLQPTRPCPDWAYDVDVSSLTDDELRSYRDRLLAAQGIDPAKAAELQSRLLEEMLRQSGNYSADAVRAKRENQTH